MNAVRSAAINLEKAPENIRKTIAEGDSNSEHAEASFQWLHEQVMLRLKNLDVVALDSEKSRLQREGARENIKAIEASVAQLSDIRSRSKRVAR